MKSADEMIAINKKQAEFYDEIQRAANRSGQYGYSRNKSANLLTRVWAGLRKRQQLAAQQARAAETGESLMIEWIRGKRGGRFLEIGCFAGSALTFPLIDACGQYVGIELSQEAVDVLNAKVAEKGLADKTTIRQGDFLQMTDDEKFDVIYAHGVLHHFQNPAPLFSKVRELIKPDGLLVFSEVSAINRLHRMVRGAYRPFQADRHWEWPFTEHTVAELEQRFQVDEAVGWGRYSLPLSVFAGVPVLSVITRPLYVSLVKKELNDRALNRVWLNSVICAKCSVK